MNQSAERLGLQKNVLRIGFDSSTEKTPFFGASNQKIKVAPLQVKNYINDQMLCNWRLFCQPVQLSIIEELWDRCACATGFNITFSRDVCSVLL